MREYNKLFTTINNQGQPTYFSGSRFIDLIREFDPNFPDYNQYIAYRNSNGLSTSRKTFFYDILNDFNNDTRQAIISRIWEEVKQSQHEKAHDEEISFFDFPASGLQEQTLPSKIEVQSSTENVKSPKVFISYSWDNSDHSSWILKLAERLINNGVEVILDKYELGPGKNMVHFMEEAIRESDKVVIIFTENYKLKAEKRQGGVGYEYSILNIDLYRNITKNNKYIPVLRNGNIQNSLPDFMQQFITIDMVNNSAYDEKFRELLLAIYDEPQVQKPPIGQRPSF